MSWPKPGSILVVDDDCELTDVVRVGLAKSRYEVVTAHTAIDALREIESRPIDVALVDLRLGEADGLAMCEQLLALDPTLALVVMTGFADLDAATGALRIGALDFLPKPFDVDALAFVLERALDRRRLKARLRELESLVELREGFESMLGVSPPMRAVFQLLERLEDSDAPVLVTGESGTGKELVARGLHARSRHREGPFVALNCAAVAASLLESTLFGHVRGAFTDAKNAHEGLFVQANRGTLFLDEIGEMPLEMQSKLLRVLQDRRVRPVGGTNEIPFETRIVTATNRNLEHAVASGTFREDLYYRINVVSVEVPPLRQRGDDVLVLAQHFVTQTRARAGKAVRGISDEAARRLLGYDWPGNIRQLQNVIERAVALTRFDRLTVDDLPERLADGPREELLVTDEKPSEMPNLEELGRRYVARVLEATGGNKTRAAKVLGLDRRTLYRKLERYGTVTRSEVPPVA